MDILQSLEYFGINKIYDIDLKVRGNPELAESVRVDIIKRCRAEYKRRALALHPDLNPDTDGAEMRKLNEAFDKIKRLNIVVEKSPERQRAAMQDYVFIMRTVMGASTSSTNSTAYTNVFHNFNW